MQQLKLKYRRIRVLFPLILMAAALIQARGQTTRIGLLIPDSSKKEVIYACEMAIDYAKRHNSKSSPPVDLVVRSTEGPWGAGSKASVDLIYEDSVVALLCALDGRNAHLAEQVAAKTQIACLEARATDPSLTQAYVPWYLRCVPSDDQQAEAILREIEELGGGKTAILSTGEYDTRKTAQSFTKIQAGSGSSGPVIINISGEDVSARDLMDQIRAKGIRHLILSLSAPVIDQLLPLLRKENPEVNIFGTHAFTAALTYDQGKWQKYEGLYLLTGAYPQSDQGKKFEAAFFEKYGYRPKVATCYTYDGMQMILEALRSSGGDREIFRKVLTNLDYKQGLTGPISFDELGNRKDAARLIKIKCE